MSTQRSPKLPAGVLLSDAGTNSHCHCSVPTRFLRAASVRYPGLNVVRFGGDALTEGIETHRIEGETVRVYNVAKTVADTFKYRNKIGLDVALEALREAWRARRFAMDKLCRYARVCRVERVMRPYLEALVA
jgi:hypothetical protein